ncbi:hypothetical protein, partial [Nocardiopsis rhodophaea]|uniref:hypothetical protein n=1 Tax=Nocardiopsis rhodophaea TaxID=280238 RepID=UPI0031E09298
MIALPEGAVRPPYAEPEAAIGRPAFDIDLVIDEFDSWTSPENATVAPTTTCLCLHSAPTAAATPGPLRASR